jgi:hypothetical protein
MTQVTHRPVEPEWFSAATNEILDVRIVDDDVDDGLYTGLTAVNVNSSDVFVQFFKGARASALTLGTDKPYHVVTIPAGDGTKRGGHDHEPPGGPIWHETSIAFAVTSTAEGSGAPATPIELTINTRA